MISLLLGDCLVKLKDIPGNSVDSIITDPPYGLVSIQKRFGKKGAAPAQYGNDGSFARLSGGFMGKKWDGTGIEYNVEMWAECLRVLKPGGHLLAFSGTRTYHRMASAIEDAGFEVRDMVNWCYSTGFPKSHNIFKHLKKECKCGIMDEYERTKKIPESLMRYMSETDVSQTISNSQTEREVLQSGLSEQSISTKGGLSESLSLSEGGEKSSLEGRGATETKSRELSGNDLCEMSAGVSTNGEKGRIHNATQISDGSTPEQTTNKNGSGASQRPQSEKQQYREPCAFCKQYGTQAIRTFGWGSAMKPAHEPIAFCRKPLEKSLTIAENCLKWGTGGINIDESRVKFEKGDEPSAGNRTATFGTQETISGGDGSGGFKSNNLGRFPANLIHDNSEEVRECFPDSKAGSYKGEGSKSGGIWSESTGKPAGMEYGDSGNASRFFKSIIYQAKASKSERNRGCEELEEIELRGGGGRAQQGYDENDTEQQRLKDAAQAYGAVKAKKSNFHPTVKPVALMEYLIKMVTPKGGIVLDPFMGSGSTGVAARINNYSFIGIEIDKDYYKIAESRINSINPLFKTQEVR